jgi:hypothetical protein
MVQSDPNLYPSLLNRLDSVTESTHPSSTHSKIQRNPSSDSFLQINRMSSLPFATRTGAAAGQLDLSSAATRLPAATATLHPSQAQGTHPTAIGLPLCLPAAIALRDLSSFGLLLCLGGFPSSTPPPPPPIFTLDDRYASADFSPDPTASDLLPVALSPYLRTAASRSPPWDLSRGKVALSAPGSPMAGVVKPTRKDMLALPQREELLFL